MMRLAEAARIVRGQLHGADAGFHAVTSDSRHTARGDLFIAIAGDTYDGHAFAAKACHAGAVGALVATKQTMPFPQLEVTDTTAALSDLATNWRARFNPPLVAVTGSNGKTTVAAMLAAIFRQCAPCLQPQHSYNNHWGVPLTLLNLRAEHGYAVIELGISRPGEMAALSQLAQPTIALINNVAPAHLQGFGTVAAVARAKAEILTGLAADGVAVLNRDDLFFPQWLEQAAGRVITFGLTEAAEVQARAVVCDGFRTRFELHLSGAPTLPITLPLAGQHNVLNALAAAAAAQAAGIRAAAIAAGLAAVETVRGRLQVMRGWQDATVIDDSYNANPASLRAAIDVLARWSGERVLVLGTMAELGADSVAHHHAIGVYAKQKQITYLYVLAADDECDDHSNDHSDAGGYATGFDGAAGRTRVYTKLADLTARVTAHMHPTTAVLIKGSRRARMERVVARVTSDTPSPHSGAPSC